MTSGRRYGSRAELRAVVFDFAHGMCEWSQCGERATELAHIVSSGMGGDPKHRRDTVDNVFAACPAHARVSDGLPPPGGGLADRNAEYLKVPGVADAVASLNRNWPARPRETFRTRDVMSVFARWLWTVRAQRKLDGGDP